VSASNDEVDLSAADLLQLQRMWDEGKVSGLPSSLDFGDLRKEARERLRQEGAADNVRSKDTDL
jgi:hypothetical protein